MSIHEASRAIQELYQIPNSAYPSAIEMERVWHDALKTFEHELHAENDPLKLEACVLADPNWDLHVEGRLALLEKAKRLGAFSQAFLMDYFGYIAAHLDPSTEKTHAQEQLQKLMNQS